MEIKIKCNLCEQELSFYREWGGNALMVESCDNCTVLAWNHHEELEETRLETIDECYGK